MSAGQLVYGLSGELSPDNLNQVSETGSVYIVDTSNNGVVVPFIANLYADAAGTVGTLEQVSVSITGLDMVFDVTLNETLSKKLLNGFEIHDVSGENFDASAADIEVNMSVSGADGFKEALAAILAEAGMDCSSQADALYTSPAGAARYNSAAGSSLKTYLENQTAKDTVDLLGYDTLSSLLEASDLMSFDIAIDASGGAADMHTKMSHDAATNADAPRFRKAIFAQIPIQNIRDYLLDSSGSHTHADTVEQLKFLPLKKGDKITFVFDVKVGEYVAGEGVNGSAPTSGAKITSVENDAAAATSNTNVGGANTTLGGLSTYNASSSSASYAGSYLGTGVTKLTFTTPTTRRVGITVTLGGEGSGIYGSQAEYETGVYGPLSVE
jgi:hypothetical protein